MILQYNEDKTIVNEEQFLRIKNNTEAGTRYLMSCSECGWNGNFYDTEHLRCKCGGLLQEVIESDSLITKLKLYRKSARMTQQQFGEKLGLSQSYVAKIESGVKAIPQNLLEFIRKL